MAATDYDFKATRNQIIEQAYRLIGVLSPGDPLENEQLVDGILTLNLLIKSLPNQHQFLFTLQEATGSLVAGDPQGLALGTDNEILAVDNLILIDGVTETPLAQITWRDYQNIAQNVTTGKPYVYAINYQPNPSIYFYYAQDKAYDFRYLATVKHKDFDTTTSDGGFPANFQKALVYALAADLADLYQKPVTERTHITTKANQFLSEAYSADREVEDRTFVRSAFK